MAKERKTVTRMAMWSRLVHQMALWTLMAMCSCLEIGMKMVIEITMGSHSEMEKAPLMVSVLA